METSMVTLLFIWLRRCCVLEFIPHGEIVNAYEYMAVFDGNIRWNNL